MFRVGEQQQSRHAEAAEQDSLPGQHGKQLGAFARAKGDRGVGIDSAVEAVGSREHDQVQAHDG